MSLKSATESSVAVDQLRQITRGSVVVALIATIGRWSNRAGQRVAAGAGARWSSRREAAEAEPLSMAAEGSRLVEFLEGWGRIPAQAWRDSRLQRILGSVLATDLATRVRLIGWVIVSGVLTHITLSSLLRVPAQTLGLTFRAALLACGLLLMWKPGTIALAWRARLGSER